MEDYSMAQGPQTVPAPLTLRWSLAACTVHEPLSGWHDQATLSEARVVGERDQSVKWDGGSRWQLNEVGGTGQGGPKGGAPRAQS